MLKLLLYFWQFEYTREYDFWAAKKNLISNKKYTIMYCNVSNFTDIVKVEFYEDDQVDFSLPFVVYEPEIYKCNPSATISDEQKVTGYCVINGKPVHTALIDDMSGELSVDSNTSVAGTKYKSTLTYNMEYGRSKAMRQEYRNQLLDLLKYNYQVVLTYITGDQQVIRTYKDGWSFSFKENKGTVSVTLTMENISGAQRVL